MVSCTKGGSTVSKTEQRRRFIINTAYLAIWVGIVFLVFRYLLNLIWPFFVAFLFAWVLKPAIRWLTVKRHWKYNLSAALCLIVFFTVIGGVAVLLTSRVVAGVSEFIVWLPSLYSDVVEPGLENLSNGLEELANRISPAAYDVVNTAMPNVISSIGSAVTNASMQLVSALSGWAAKLPSRLLSAVICVIATIFMTVDFARMNAFILRQVPERPRHIITEARDSLRVILRKYGKSYGIILCITFAEVLTGFLILGQENALLLALAVAVFDIFPIVGVGTILIPWGTITLLGGGTVKGAGLLVLWLVTVVVRQFIEPRIVGRQVGLHPLITLAAMFVGTKLFGAVGLFGLPITCAIVQSLDEAGVIHLIKKEDALKDAKHDGEHEPAENTEKG